MSQTKPHTAAQGSLSNVLSGRFLISPRVLRQAPFVLYLVFLTLLMVASSHSAERKVHEINQLNHERRELHSQFIETRALLMRESMESKVLSRAADLGLGHGSEPPIVLRESKKDKP